MMPVTTQYIELDEPLAILRCRVGFLVLSAISVAGLPEVCQPHHIGKQPNDLT